MSDFIDRESKDLERLILTFYLGANKGLTAKTNGLRKRIRRYIDGLSESELSAAKRKARLKDVKFFERLFKGAFVPDKKTLGVIGSEYKRIFEASASSAAKEIGFLGKVILTNKELLENLKARVGTFPESSKHHFSDAISTIRKHFIENGEAPYNSKFINELRTKLNFQARWDAVRFARTETGVIGSGAQSEMFKRSGVDRKSWSNLSDARDWHQNIDGPIPMDEPFIVDGEAMMHPHDPAGSARNIINCRCSLAPHPSKEIEEVWDGA